MAFTFAVSISGLLGNVGTVAGLVAALAVAVLATVVLGQGSEVKRLREEVDAEADRAYAAEAALAIEVASAGRQVREVIVEEPSVSAVPVAAVSAPVQPTAANTSVVADSAGAPALGSATASPVIAAVAGGGPAVELKKAVEVPQAAEPLPVAQVRTDRPAPIVIPSPGSATVAARSDIASKSIGDPATSAAGAGPRSPRPPVRDAAASKRRNPIPILIVTVFVIVGVVFALNQFGSGSSDTAKAPTSSSQTGATTSSGTGSGSVVAVLNGTPVSGLAGTVAGELEKAGFKRGRVASARDQQAQTTVIAYMPGHAADAEAVAKALRIDASVVPADESMQAVACPDAATCTAEVIVTVGADRTR